jgi:SRSO17 transposase
MGLGEADASESRFVAYVDGLASVIGHKDRIGPLRDYCRGLMLPCERKSVEPMAAVTAPSRTSAQHQSLLHFVGEGRWLDDTVLGKVRELVLPGIERQGPIEAWIIDDTGLPKQGRHSVGVARQYCGQLGKQDNCQVAVSLSLANRHASLPVAYRLYLPAEWIERGGARPAFPTTSRLPPSRRSRLNTCAGLVPPVCHAPWCCSTLAMAIAVRCAPT